MSSPLSPPPHTGLARNILFELPDFFPLLRPLSFSLHHFLSSVQTSLPPPTMFHSDEMKKLWESGSRCFFSPRGGQKLSERGNLMPFAQSRKSRSNAPPFPPAPLKEISPSGRRPSPVPWFSSGSCCPTSTYSLEIDTGCVKATPEVTRRGLSSYFSFFHKKGKNFAASVSEMERREGGVD